MDLPSGTRLGAFVIDAPLGAGGMGEVYRATELVERGEAATRRDRHLRFFSALAVDGAQKVIGPDQIDWVERLELEHDNLRAALEGSLTRHAKSEAPLLLASALWPFWNRRNHFAEGQKWLQRALSACPHASIPARACALVAVADLSFFAGDWVTLRACCEEAITQPDTALGDARWTKAFACFALANDAANHGRFDDSVRLAERSLAISRETGTTWVACLALIVPAFVALNTGDPARAQVLLEEAVTLARPLGDRWERPRCLVPRCVVCAGERPVKLSWGPIYKSESWRPHRASTVRS